MGRTCVNILGAFQPVEILCGNTLWRRQQVYRYILAVNRTVVDQTQSYQRVFMCCFVFMYWYWYSAIARKDQLDKLNKAINFLPTAVVQQ